MTRAACHAWMHFEHDEPQKVVFFLFFSIKNIKVSLVLKVQTKKKKEKKEEEEVKKERRGKKAFQVKIKHYIHF